LPQESEVAQAFNDQAVTENLSIRAALAMLRREEELNFLQEAFQANEIAGRQNFRHIVTDIVLGTDMKRHFNLLKQFHTEVMEHPVMENILAGPRGPETSAQLWTAMDEAQRMLCLQMALKMADIGHCALPMDQHLVWLLLLEEEMFKQGDKEKHLGLPVSPLMDRTRPG
jgi:hypothetical protein